MQPERGQDLRADAVLAQPVRRDVVADLELGAHVAQEDDDPAPLGGDEAHGVAELVAAAGMDAEEVLERVHRVHPHQHRLGRGEVALGEHDMLAAAGVSVKTRICQAPPYSEVTVSTAVSRTRLS